VWCVCVGVGGHCGVGDTRPNPPAHTHRQNKWQTVELVVTEVDSAVACVVVTVAVVATVATVAVAVAVVVAVAVATTRTATCGVR